ncbi:MAG: type III pantothenate kinase [Pseudopedobacter saltans]|uniref:Type III pantothenate kinase n=1 Tax=Pseudopedobacter saltans TaxID=151895 RepID=A0A2W5H1J7_9SPHI|nr:MAG: type III pantothenate kinase [Pseudopedobacter saltans]
MSKIVCFDFGNTRHKCAVFEDKNFLKEIVLEDRGVEAVLQVLNSELPEYTILSSVVHHDPAIETLLAEKTKFHKVSYLSKMVVDTPFPTKTNVGADRWALLSAAAELFPKKHCLVIGLGSCVTYNFLNNMEVFLGGSISPGLHMRFKAMNDYTALLPLQEPQWNIPLVGYDTPTNLLSGVILGMSKEIDGIIDLYKQKYNNLQVLMTGGDMPFFSSHLKNEIYADAQLVYKGIWSIGKLNLNF